MDIAAAKRLVPAEPSMAGPSAEALHTSMANLSLDDKDVEIHPTRSFRFFDLPSELRIRIYKLHLLTPERLVDLDPMNYRRILPRMATFLVSKRMHQEAAQVFYGQQTLRLFPMHGRFFNTKVPLLTRLSPSSRALITSLEIRLGPGWSAPPRCQMVDDRLGLEQCTSLRTLKIFVELDPSGDIFNGFRGKGNARDTYKIFCTQLLGNIMERVPGLSTVELDAYPSVTKTSPMVVALVARIEKAGKKLVWGPLRGWDQDRDGCGQIGLESALAEMTL